jgi:hypothetical protein
MVVHKWWFIIVANHLMIDNCLIKNDVCQGMLNFREITMNDRKFNVGEYCRKEVEWENGWVIMTNPRQFATRFNSTVPGAYRQVTAEDIRQMAQCGLIGRCGFFTREDLETVRGLLRFEQLRQHATEQIRELEFVHSANRSKQILIHAEA